MVRGLWTAASGMTAQQLNVDTIANNLSNVNTTGYKKETTNFKSLLYANLGAPAEQEVQPNKAQVGHGVRALANSRNFSTGVLTQTENTTDLAIQGDGFFAIDRGDGNVAYTKDGSFRFSVLADEGAYALVTSTGDPVLNTEGESIIMTNDIAVDSLTIDTDGSIYYMDKDTNTRMDVAQIQVVQFPNVQGLEGIGNNYYVATANSGEALVEGEDEGISRSTIRSGYLEGSNVQVADEMVKLIVAQRAYELSSKAIQTVDEMLQQANDLKR